MDKLLPVQFTGKSLNREKDKLEASDEDEIFRDVKFNKCSHPIKAPPIAIQA